MATIDFFDRVDRLCKERGISQRELQSACGLPQGTVSKWRHCTPRLSAATKVAEFFGVTLDYLVGLPSMPWAEGNVLIQTEDGIEAIYIEPEIIDLALKIKGKPSISELSAVVRRNGAVMVP